MKPASKALGLHRIFICGKGPNYVIADSTFERMQVDPGACWLDAGEPTVWGEDTLRPSLHVACGKWEDAMPDARRGGGIWRAAQK